MNRWMGNGRTGGCPCGDSDTGTFGGDTTFGGDSGGIDMRRRGLKKGIEERKEEGMVKDGDVGVGAYDILSTYGKPMRTPSRPKTRIRKTHGEFTVGLSLYSTLLFSTLCSFVKIEH